MKISVGKVLKAQGIKGELKLSCLLDNVEQLCSLKSLYLGDKPMTVMSSHTSAGFAIVKFAEISDRNTAELYVNWEVYAVKESIPLAEDSYFVDDLIGCRVLLNNGKEIGTVTNVIQNGAADVFTVEKPDKKVMFPFLKDLTVSVDIERKLITLKEKRFSEVCLYED